MPAKIAVIYYSTYGHITKLTEEVVAGAKATGAHVDVFRVPETLSAEILAKQHAAPANPEHPEMDPHRLPEYDGFIFGFPTRYGRAPAQVSAFFDSTGKEWAAGALVGKLATMYTSTASQHGGLESTYLTTMPYFAHHGIAYVPIGYANPELTKLDVIIGASAYGTGTVAGGDGSRQPVQEDLTVARAQGTYFANFTNTFVAGKAASAANAGTAATATTTTAAEAAPASAAAAAAVPATRGATTAAAEAKPYTVDAPATPAAAGATTTAGTAATPAANPDTATTTAAAPTSATPAQSPATKATKPKKGGLFARCCGNEKDYAA